MHAPTAYQVWSSYRRHIFGFSINQPSDLDPSWPFDLESGARLIPWGVQPSYTFVLDLWDGPCDLVTLTFNLGGHGICRWYGSSDGRTDTGYHFIMPLPYEGGDIIISMDIIIRIQIRSPPKSNPLFLGQLCVNSVNSGIRCPPNIRVCSKLFWITNAWKISTRHSKVGIT